ncbi:MAG TPA: WD40 repeat domain-containing protein, partial [Tepidisphaeraceae bacterium]
GTQVIVTTLHELVDGPVRVFDAESAKPLRTFGQQVNRCEVAAGGTAAICVPLLRTKADTPSLWDPATGRQIQQLPHIESPDVFFSPDGTTLLLETEPGVTSVWRLEPCRPTTRP